MLSLHLPAHWNACIMLSPLFIHTPHISSWRKICVRKFPSVNFSSSQLIMCENKMIFIILDVDYHPRCMVSWIRTMKIVSILRCSRCDIFHKNPVFINLFNWYLIVCIWLRICRIQFPERKKRWPRKKMKITHNTVEWKLIVTIILLHTFNVYFYCIYALNVFCEFVKLVFYSGAEENKCPREKVASDVHIFFSAALPFTCRTLFHRLSIIYLALFLLSLRIFFVLFLFSFSFVLHSLWKIMRVYINKGNFQMPALSFLLFFWLAGFLCIMKRIVN